MAMTIAAAHEQWKSESLPALIEMYGKDDDVAFSEDWNNYTDALCKAGDLTNLQYHHCPAWDAVEHEDDTLAECAFILEEMGITIDATQILERDDGLMGDSSTHYRIAVSRMDMHVFDVQYSMGAAYTEAPSCDQVINSLLRDTEGLSDDSTFENWAEDMGMDSDSRAAERMFNGCKQELVDLNKLCKPNELDDLREIFQDY